MTNVQVKKRKKLSLSRNPYSRGDEVEMTRIVNEVQSGIIGIRAACFKYGLNRNTLKLWITRITVRNLESNMTKKRMKKLMEDSDSKTLERKVYELTRALEHAKLKINSLETLIKVSEEDFQIKIRKKPGTKRSIE